MERITKRDFIVTQNNLTFATAFENVYKLKRDNNIVLQSYVFYVHIAVHYKTYVFSRPT
jgi:hypothetical protein